MLTKFFDMLWHHQWPVNEDNEMKHASDQLQYIFVISVLSDKNKTSQWDIYMAIPDSI